MNELFQDAQFVKQYEIGMEGEDWILMMFNLRGFPIRSLKSEKNQHDFGDSTAGIELKRDRNMRATGNLFVMHHAKYTASQPYFHKTALLHDNGIWLYCFYDQYECFLIPKTTLVRLYYEREKLGLKDITIKQGTSQGYLLPKSRFKELFVECGHWVFTEEERAYVNSRVKPI